MGSPVYRLLLGTNATCRTENKNATVEVCNRSQTGMLTPIYN